MDRIQKIILISIISIAAISWIVSKDQPDMMAAMMNYNPVAISLFTISWTIGMAAMMFPAITPMVLLYNRLVKNNGSNGGAGNTLGKDISPSQTSVFVEHDEDDNRVKRERRSSLLLSNLTSSINITIHCRFLSFSLGYNRNCAPFDMVYPSKLFFYTFSNQSASSNLWNCIACIWSISI